MWIINKKKYYKPIIITYIIEMENTIPANTKEIIPNYIMDLSNIISDIKRNIKG